MISCTEKDLWSQFLDYMRGRLTATAFNNWLSPVEAVEITPSTMTLSVPNIFVKEYLLSNFKNEMQAFFPLTGAGEPAISFVIAKQKSENKSSAEVNKIEPLPTSSYKSATSPDDLSETFGVKLNENYRFSTYIEGAANQFVKSAAVGVASRPGQSYNPLFIHGGVGLGKTHLLHSIGHHVKEHNRRLQVQCITTEAFINQLVDSLRNKSVDRMKRFYRNNVDVLLVDDIQFLQNRPNLEEEFANTFEALINQKKQIVITCDKAPSLLKLSERMVARMEWGLVANVGMPDLETRVAILQHKAEQRGLTLPNEIAFMIAENLCNNVRQLEGAVNRLSANLRLMNQAISLELVQRLLGDMFRTGPSPKISVDDILKSVSTVFQVRFSDLKSDGRSKEMATARQVAMFLAKELINDSLVQLASCFGKTHSTLIHGVKSVEKKMAQDEYLRRQIDMVKRSLVLQ